MSLSEIKILIKQFLLVTYLRIINEFLNIILLSWAHEMYI